MTTLARTPAYVRSDALDHVARRLEERRDEVAALIVAENGKPVRWALGEVNRARSAFRWAAEEARRWSGDLQRLDTFGTLEEAFAEVDDSRFGLQVGVFTHDLQVAFEAHAALEVGGVVIGDVPSYWADQMPYGGVKEPGRP